MATIKSMVSDKLRQKGERPNCERIREIVRRIINRLCEPLPDGTPEGHEFEYMISKSLDRVGTGPNDILVDAAIEERNDLCEYPHLRHNLECAIKDWK